MPIYYVSIDNLTDSTVYKSVAKVVQIPLEYFAQKVDSCSIIRSK